MGAVGLEGWSEHVVYIRTVKQQELKSPAGNKAT